MGDSSQNDSRRRYARPGEFKLPELENRISILESSSFNQRLGGQLNRGVKTPTAPTVELRPEVELNPAKRTLAPPPPEVRPVGGLNSIPGSVPAAPTVELRPAVNLNLAKRTLAPPLPEVRLVGGLNSIPGSVPTAPTVESRPAVKLNPAKRTLAPPPIDVRPIAELNSIPSSVRPAVPQMRLGGGLNSVPRSLAPAPRLAHPVGEFSIQQRMAPLVNKSTISTRRVSARFALLPDPPSKLNRFGWSAAAQLAVLGLLLLSPMIFPQQMQTALKFDVMDLVQPVTYLKVDVTPKPQPPPPPKVKPKVPPPEPKPIVPKPKQAEVEPPELNPRQPHIFLVLKPQLPKDHKVEVKPVELRPMFAQAEIVLSTNQPKRPKEEMKAPILQPMRAKADIKAPDVGLGGPVPATILAAANKVQTGGFGDLNGIRGPANPGKAGNINQAGSPNLPGGPGLGNGSGGAQGLRGTVASDGSTGSRGGAPATGGASSGVSILYEPNPAYTNEARVLKMEGDIVLEVVFLASGQLQVIRVVSGLGHGLDEAAIQAAKQIRFRPATRNGQPFDFPAHVRIEFRLAK